MINEASLQKLGWTDAEQALGKRVSFGGLEKKIIGVVKSFNFKSLHEPVEPLAMILAPENARYFTLRFQTANLPGLVASLGQKWQELAPQQPFDYFFLDDQIDAQYRDEFCLSHRDFLVGVCAGRRAGAGDCTADVSTQAIRAALANSVESLRYE